MANTDQEETKTRKLADHGLIGADGAAVDEQEKATGVTYKDLATGQVATYQIPGAVAGSVQTMLAIFGAKTLATNTASANKQNDYPVGNVEAINTRFAAIVDGDWGVERGGGGGVRIDIDLLVEALAVQFKREKQPFDPDKYRTKITEDEAYRKRVFGLDSVKAQYLILRAAKAGSGVAGIALD